VNLDQTTLRIALKASALGLLLARVTQSLHRFTTEPQALVGHASMLHQRAHHDRHLYRLFIRFIGEKIV